MLITEDFSLISITSFISYKLLTFTKKKLFSSISNCIPSIAYV